MGAMGAGVLILMGLVGDGGATLGAAAANGWAQVAGAGSDTWNRANDATSACCVWMCRVCVRVQRGDECSRLVDCDYVRAQANNSIFKRLTLLASSSTRSSARGLQIVAASCGRSVALGNNSLMRDGGAAAAAGFDFAGAAAGS